MEGNREKWRNPSRCIWILSGILTVISVLVMYKTHKTIPFMMDDLWYSTMLSDETPISSFMDIVKSQIWHYFNWGGRSMTHGILQMTLLAGEQAADILNVLVTLLLAAMVCLVSGNRRLPGFFAALGMTLGLNANWRMSMFWQAGAANYLYITVFILAFAYCYLRELSDEGSCLPWKLKACAPENGDAFQAKALPGIMLWIIPLGILAGWSNENMGPAVWALSVAVIVILIKEKRRVKPWMILGNLSCLAGSAMCIAAPGNLVRSAQVQEAQYGIMWRLFLRGYAESKAALEFLFPVLLVLVFLCILHGRGIGRRNILLLFCALLSWGAFVLSPHYPDRASFGTMMLCICVILSLSKKILRHRKELEGPLWGAAVLIWLRGMFFCGEFLAASWGWIR